jgi:hypothetical protein
MELLTNPMQTLQQWGCNGAHECLLITVEWLTVDGEWGDVV